MQALAIQSSSELAHRGGLHYVYGAIASPVCVASAIFATCVGGSFAGSLGALLGVAVLVGVCVVLARFGFVRRHLDRQGMYYAIATREANRLRQLRPTGPVRVHQYTELRDLVDEIERRAPAEAKRLELQPLLDHFTRVAVSHFRCLESLRFAQDADFAPIVRSKRRGDIRVRRLAHRAECMKRIERQVDELEAIEELVRLCAQRVACPDIDPELDREIDRRMWAIDEVDDALAELSA